MSNHSSPDQYGLFETLAHDHWPLMNGTAINQRHPKTFLIPSESERRSLRCGDLAKLGFEGDLEAGLAGERMWVVVTSVKGRKYAGCLICDPVQLPLEYGQQFAFSPKHVIDIVRREDPSVCEGCAIN